MKDAIKSVAIGFISAIILNILEKWGPDNIMTWFWQNIIVAFWPEWIGIGVGLLCFIIYKAIFIYKTAEKISLIDERQVKFMAEQNKRVDGIVAKKERFINEQNKIMADFSNVNSSLEARLDKLEAEVFSND